MPTIGGRAHNPDAAEKVAELCYPFAEISMKNPEGIRSEIKMLLDIKSRYGIGYIGHFPNEDHPVNPEILRERFLPKVKGILDQCPELSIGKCTLHFWMDIRWIDPAVANAKIPIIREIVDYASDRNVVICIENLSEQHTSFEPLFNEIPGLKMTLDIGHAQLLSKENSSFGFIENCFDRIDHIHVHDNMGGTRLEDDLHLPLGQGIIDYPAIFTMLKEKGYDSTITMELKPEELEQTKLEIIKYF